MICLCRYTSGGFTVNDTHVQGAVLCLSNLVLHWHVQSLADISVDSLAVLDIIKPKPGDRPDHPASLKLSIIAKDGSQFWSEARVLAAIIELASFTACCTHYLCASAHLPMQSP